MDRDHFKDMEEATLLRNSSVRFKVYVLILIRLVKFRRLFISYFYLLAMVIHRRCRDLPDWRWL